MIDERTADAFAAEWIAAWNSHDLPRILSHYADDFEFSSPIIVEVVGEPSGTLVGKAAIGAYWTKALARRPDLRFALVAVLRGMRSLVIHYRRHDGRLASELVELGTDGKVVRSIAHYGGGDA
ncbi:MAG TPA: nuclear transport factor 2 family protein [Candidatus Binatia bacterium]|jgi:hypothetical protein|nr:nuclear transport factor 2 family protein [Candidatus Binatia bacterium]